MRFTFSTLSLLTFGFAAFSSLAQAGTMHCSDAHRTVEYSASRPDGGANRGNDINWVINNVHLIEETPFEIGTPSREASSEFSQEIELSTGKLKEDYETSSFVVLAKVSKYPSQELIFEGFLICNSTRYVGIPRP